MDREVEMGKVLIMAVVALVTSGKQGMIKYLFQTRRTWLLIVFSLLRHHTINSFLTQSTTEATSSTQQPYTTLHDVQVSTTVTERVHVVTTIPYVTTKHPGHTDDPIVVLFETPNHFLKELDKQSKK